MPSVAGMTKPVLPPLQTPKSASFPSEIVSTPLSACIPNLIKQEQDLKTPITPPTAYTDFLKALTPILASPPPSALGRSLSDDSITSGRESLASNGTKSSSFSAQSGADQHKSPTTMSLPPPTPQSAPNGRNPASLKRLRIPQYSPIFSPGASALTPRTALSSNGGSAINSAILYSPFSPADWNGRSSNNFDFVSTPRSACSKPVSVRSVVTRTVTYKRTTPNLEPAPKGKKRKISSSNCSVTSEEETKHKMPPPPSISVSAVTEPEGPTATASSP